MLGNQDGVSFAVEFGVFKLSTLVLIHNVSVVAVMFILKSVAMIRICVRIGHVRCDTYFFSNVIILKNNAVFDVTFKIELD